MAHPLVFERQLSAHPSRSTGKNDAPMSRQSACDRGWDKPALRGLDLERRVSDEPAAREAAPGCFQEYLPFSRAIFLLY